MRILITGANGFVGANLVRWLAETHPQTQIIATDRHPADVELAAFFAPVADQLTHLPLDVTDRAAFQRLANETQATHLIHAAAVTPNIEQERAAPASIIDINLGGAINALEACLQVASIKRAVLISSTGVYGASSEQSAAPQTEDGPLQLDNLYSITKHSAELLAARYATLSSKPIVAARLTAIYGPMERPAASRTALSHVGQLLAALRAGRETGVAGAAYARDWLHARDVANAVAGLLHAPELRYDVYNIGSGEATLFATLVAAFERHGLRARWVEDASAATIAMRPHQARAPLDCSRLFADTNVRPTISLADGIAELIREFC